MLSCLHTLTQVDQDEATRLETMPSMVIQTEPKQYTYILPPILYPDNRYYIKFGQHDLTRVLTTWHQAQMMFTLNNLSIQSFYRKSNQ